MALQGDYRQKYRHYGKLFINLPVVGLPCFGVFDIDDFCTKKRTKFHYFIGFSECFYLNLQPISITSVKELKLQKKTNKLELNM